jgi:hypothetical protein
MARLGSPPCSCSREERAMTSTPSVRRLGHRFVNATAEYPGARGWSRPFSAGRRTADSWIAPSSSRWLAVDLVLRHLRRGRDRSSVCRSVGRRRCADGARSLPIHDKYAWVKIDSAFRGMNLAAPVASRVVEAGGPGLTRRGDEFDLSLLLFNAGLPTRPVDRSRCMSLAQGAR